MLFSRSEYFKQSKEALHVDRINVNVLLTIKGYNKKSVDIYTKAFDYFVANPNDFDGATVVKDLVDIHGLDLDAMLHDYHYIVYKAATNFRTKWISDWLYAKGQERKGKGQYSSFSRFIGLSIIGVIFVPYSILTKGRQSTENVTALQLDSATLLNN